MKRLISCISLFVGLLLITGDLIFAAHVLEPVGTEIAATPPRGRMFAQIEYVYSKDDPDGMVEMKTHSIGLEFEIGVGERTQLNLEIDVVVDRTMGDENTCGLNEYAVGVKHRFLDETETLPDMAFLVEVAPGTGLTNNESELKLDLLLTKNFNNKFLTHFDIGYILETEIEDDEAEHASIVVYNIAPIYRLIPDKLLLVAELNGVSNTETRTDAISVAPEVIYVYGNNAIKVAVPLGLTDDADDIGFRFALSRLY